MTEHANARLSIREERIEEEASRYKEVLSDVLKGHPGEQYLVVGFKEGMNQGLAIGSAAVASGVNKIIGQIETGLITEAADIQSALIQLRNVAQQEIGL